MQRMTFVLFFVLSFSVFGQDYRGAIEIIRDKWGVPHIYAPTDKGVAYGLAWAHAEDDFETVQLPLLSSKQLMGSYLGKDGAAIDYVVGLLRCDQIVQEHFNELSPEFLEVLSGYVEGINAYAAYHPNEVLVRNAFPITVRDALGAYVLSLSVMSGIDGLIKGLVEGKVEKAGDPGGTGSNAIAISNKLTTSDETFLAVNSHQPLEGPVAWYEAHLVSEEGWNAMGGLFPGGTTIFHGTNPYLGWAHTVNYPDKVDVFELEMHPEDPLKYKFDDEYLTLQKEEIKLKVKIFLGLKIGVKRDAFYSVYGPVIKNDRGYFAFHTGAFDDIRAGEQWYRMNKARNFAEFKEALKMTAIPGFNIVYADANDTIYHLGNAKLPVRTEGYDWSKTLPGNTSKTLTSNYHPLEDLPSNLNPAAGFIFNTNNSAFSSSAPGNNPDSADYDPLMGYRIWENNRSARFLELMKERKKLNFDDFLSIKYDLQLPDSLLFRIDMNTIDDLTPGSLSDKAKEIRALISEWDRIADLDAIGAVHSVLTYQFLDEKLNVPKRGAVRPSEKQLEYALESTYDYLMKYFGKTKVSLGEYQFLVRGDKALPMQGIDDVLAAMRSVPWKDGRVKAYQGESYIMMIRYRKDKLPIIETVNAYGASNHEEGPHYDDQMNLFVQQKRKPMTLDIEEVRKNAERIYQPGVVK